MSIGGNSNDVLPKNKTQKGAKIAHNITLSMFQKSRHRKWVNNVGDLNTCIENTNVMYKKNVKGIMTPDLMGLDVEVGRLRFMLHKYQLLQITKFACFMLNSAYKKRTDIPICICNKTADLPQDNAKDPNSIF